MCPFSSITRPAFLQTPTLPSARQLSRYLLAAWALFAGLTGCKHDPDPVAPIVTPIPSPDSPENPALDPTGLICPVGESTGSYAISKAIGPAGGTLKSEDGRIRLEIPAGALNRTENIQIEPITNTNPTGKGSAYRLQPHGTTFAKPVKLTFAYSDNDLNGTVAEAFQIACQDDKGVWTAMPGVKLNRQAQTITVETTHFSDWSYFSSVYLSPQQRGVRPGEAVPMAVYTTLVMDEDEALLAPLVEEQVVIPSQLLVRLGADKTVPVIRWAISEGIGKLATTGTGSTNTYTAPTGIVKPTPVTVTAQVKAAGNHLFLLLSSMMIMPEGLVYRLDGGPWIHRPGVAQRLGGQVVTLGAAKPSSGDTGLSLAITIPQVTGSRNINLDWGPGAMLTASPVSGYLHYECYYGLAGQFSPGSLFISDIRYSAKSPGVEFATVNGGFTVTNAGAYDASGYVGSHLIEGFFCIGKTE